MLSCRLRADALPQSDLGGGTVRCRQEKDRGRRSSSRSAADERGTRTRRRTCSTTTGRRRRIPSGTPAHPARPQAGSCPRRRVSRLRQRLATDAHRKTMLAPLACSRLTRLPILLGNVSCSSVWNWSASNRSPTRRSSTFPPASPASSGPTGRARATWWTPCAGCWASRAPRACAAAR